MKSCVAGFASRLAIGVACVGVLALVTGSTAGASLLKPPFEHYTLTYQASDTAQGSLVSTLLAPAPGFSLCESLPDSSIRENSSAHALMSYALTFGRYHARGERTRLALLYKVAAHAVTGSAEATEVESPRAGCPPLLPELMITLENATCQQQIGVGSDVPSLDFEANASSTLFEAVFSLKIDVVGQPSCSGNTDPGSGAGEPYPSLAADFGTPSGEGPLPTVATIGFSASAIEHRRTVHGHVEILPADVPASGQGVEATFEGTGQRAWSFSSSPAGTFTLAPASAGH